MTRLILPNQLFTEINDEEVYLLEHPRYFTEFDFHKKKLVLHRASMKKFESGFEGEITYVEYDGDFDKIFEENDELLVYRPEDHKLRNWLQEKCKKHVTSLKLEESPLFLNSMDYNRSYFESNSYFQLSYYKEQRKKHNILLTDDGNPIGGKWSFDPENRKKLPEDHKTPEIPTFNSKHTEEAIKYVENNFTNNPGKLADFNYPISREQALKNLDDFLENRMGNFGEYQDAIDASLTHGYHSLLSPGLNIGLITPQEIVKITLEKHNEKDFPLNSLEGFLRQIIGWREFIRAIYHLEPDMKENNHWNAENSLPEEFYSGETSLTPLDHAIERVRRIGYTHHIERLMILGNMMLLLEINPDEVYSWFMEMFIDSYDWVMTPNVYGMSQYSYTEMMTKPYISSSNYIQKMSNYKSGEWEKYWDGLYWNFIHKHNEKISEIPRMGFMNSTLERMNKETIENHLSNAEKFKQQIGL